MSQTIFPNSKRAVPKTNAERAAFAPQMEQPAGGIKIQLEDPEDPPGEEMTKNARVWKTYVREADRWDKEMVDGRNSSLDVLLIFAALFSAISTAFILESLGDLKPDPAERSVDALLAISEKLDAILTGQQNTPSPILDSSSNKFAPSYSAVVVNILWLLSLSLSVAVSLIAMLAKEWCYKFMAGRSGAIYNQARRRQQKWDGIEKWKMQEMLGYLPGLMHSALLLFAVGLCIYLWDINLGVAIPVTVVTAMAGCIYTSTTLLPFFYCFCPYSTPATPIVNIVRHFMQQVLFYICLKTNFPGWLWRLCRYLIHLDPNLNISDENKEDTFAHMDIVTSRMLAWMIVNCEDSRSVGVALQAISGAQTTLPLAPLEKCDAISRIESALYPLLERKAESRRYSLRDENSMRTALRYCRAGSVFMRGNMLNNWVPNFQFHRIVEIHISLFASLDRSLADIDGSELSVNTASYLLYLCLDWESFHNEFPWLEKLSLRPAAAIVSSALEGHVNRSSSPASIAVLVTILDSCAYYMIKDWATEIDFNKSQTLTLLVRIFLQYYYTTNYDVTSIIASSLAAATFAVNWYPGGDRPSQPSQGSTKRAVQVMRSYQTNHGQYSIAGAFTFAFLALLPYIDLNELQSHPQEVLWLQRVAITSLPFTDLPPTIPACYTWAAHINSASQNMQPPITEIPEIPGISPESIALYILLLRAGVVHHGMLLPILAMLRHAKSQALQDLCIKRLVSAPITGNWSYISEISDDPDIIRAVIDHSHVMDKYTSTVVIFYFRLVIGNIMLCDNTELLNRQNLLKSRLFNVQGFQSLKPTSKDRALPPVEHMLDHVAEQTEGTPVSECMLHTLQLVTDFCHADPGKYQYAQAEPLESEEVPEWVMKLQAIKNNFKPCRADVQVPAVTIGEAQAEPVHHVAPSKAETGSANGTEQAERGAEREIV